MKYSDRIAKLETEIAALKREKIVEDPEDLVRSIIFSETPFHQNNLHPPYPQDNWSHDQLVKFGQDFLSFLRDNSEFHSPGETMKLIQKAITKVKR